MNSGSVSNPPESLILSRQKSSDARIGINAAAASQSQVKTCQIISAGKNITVMADQNIAIKDLISKKQYSSNVKPEMTSPQVYPNANFENISRHLAQNTLDSINRDHIDGDVDLNQALSINHSREEGRSNSRPRVPSMEYTNANSHMYNTQIDYFNYNATSGIMPNSGADSADEAFAGQMMPKNGSNERHYGRTTENFYTAKIVTGLYPQAGQGGVEASKSPTSPDSSQIVDRHQKSHQGRSGKPSARFAANSGQI